MPTVRALQVDAFTTEPLAGNAAGVVPEADGLTDDQMGAIAAELAVSETAFLRASDDADRRIRYFTPTTEVDLCGHATVAAHAHLHDDGVLAPGVNTLETNVGVLEVEVEDDGTVWMTQDDPEIREVDLGYERVGAALGVDHAAMEDVGADLPLAVASTGVPFLVVPVNFLEHVGGMDPDFGAVEAVTDEVGATGVYAFTFDALSGDATLHGRAFAPAAGIPEDPVTGTASGAVGAYLREYDAFEGSEARGASSPTGTDGEPGGMPEEMTFEQGHFVDRTGHVRVRVGEGVRVGGRAATALDGRLRVPDAADDDIIDAR